MFAKICHSISSLSEKTYKEFLFAGFLFLCYLFISVILISEKTYSAENGRPCVGSNIRNYDDCFGSRKTLTAEYEGNFKDGQFHGEGTLTSRISGKQYSGHWRQNQRSGYGIQRDASSSEIYKGEFDDDEKNGLISYFENHGLKRIAIWKNNRELDIVKSCNEDYDQICYDQKKSNNHRQLYAGTFKNNNRHGLGVLIEPNGDYWFGYWLNGKKTKYGESHSVKDINNVLRLSFNKLEKDKRFEIQEVLRQLKYYDDFIDGLYGKHTFEALVKFLIESNSRDPFLSFIKAVNNDEPADLFWKKILNTLIFTERADCSSDLTGCSEKEICINALSYRNGKLVYENNEWSDLMNLRPYVEMAKDKQLTCTINEKLLLVENEIPNCPVDKKISNLECFGIYEFDDGRHYRGVLKNGKPNGLGKAIGKDQSVYLGQFINGKYHGIGTVSLLNNGFYEGEFKENKMHGDGKRIYSNIDGLGGYYQGGVINGMNDGYGLREYPNGSRYVGNWSKDFKHGYGIFTQSDGTIYDGYWLDGLRSGKGKQEYPDGGIDDGVWQSNKLNGYAESIFSDGSSYKGLWRNGLKHGKGLMTFAGGEIYDGNWENDLKNGEGTSIYPNGTKYEGNWKNNQKNGRGKEKQKNGTSYDGEWLDGKKHGQGRSDDEGIIYEGNWENGDWNGKGTLTQVDGEVYKGNFLSGSYHGMGELKFSNGEILVGKFKNGVFLQKITCDTSPELCGDIELCEKATIRTNGQKQWRTQEGYAKYISIAKLKKLSCGVQQGQQYALLIGVNKYQYMQNLASPLRDIRKVGALLQENYNFQVSFLEDVTEKDIYKKLSELKDQLNEDDKFLIYFAGHGKMREDEGYWLPSDAEEGNESAWVSNQDIKRKIRHINSRNILVIADTCFAGTITRGLALSSPNESNDIDEYEKTKTRAVIASGGLESILDVGEKGHSVFAEALIENLRGRQEPFTAFELYKDLNPIVISRSKDLGKEQTPVYLNPLETGHIGPAYVFFPKILKN